MNGSDCKHVSLGDLGSGIESLTIMIPSLPNLNSDLTTIPIFLVKIVDFDLYSIEFEQFGSLFYWIQPIFEKKITLMSIKDQKQS